MGRYFFETPGRKSATTAQMYGRITKRERYTLVLICTSLMFKVH